MKAPESLNAKADAARDATDARAKAGDAATAAYTAARDAYAAARDASYADDANAAYAYAAALADAESK